VTSAKAKRASRKEGDRGSGEAAAPSLAAIPAVLTDHIFSMVSFQDCCQVAKTCKSLREVAGTDAIWRQHLAKRHALLGSEGVDPRTVPGGPCRGHSCPPYSEETNRGARAQWVECLSQLDKDRPSMPAKAKYRELHSRQLPLPTCGCNTMYRGYLCPRGEYDICAQPVVRACGVSGCAACFCRECVSGTFHGLDYESACDATGNRPSRMESCQSCGVTVCYAHLRELMQRRTRNSFLCVDCVASERPSSGKQAAGTSASAHDDSDYDSEFDGGSSYGMPESLMGGSSDWDDDSD
jgi:hypothetical protein